MKVILSSVQTMVNLLQRNPKLYCVPAFQVLRPVVDMISRPGGCGCNERDLLDSIRPHFESALTGITADQRRQIKDILKATEVCYYVYVNGNITLKCF